MWCNVEKTNEWFILFLKFSALSSLLYDMRKINEGFIKSVDDIKYWKSMPITFEDFYWINRYMNIFLVNQLIAVT